jgi:hypothetical protein
LSSLYPAAWESLKRFCEPLFRSWRGRVVGAGGEGVVGFLYFMGAES